MLEFGLTKRHAGMVIWGDTWALRAVHGLVLKVIDAKAVHGRSRSPMSKRLSTAVVAIG
jgi:hypothetical protein